MLLCATQMIVCNIGIKVPLIPLCPIWSNIGDGLMQKKNSFFVSGDSIRHYKSSYSFDIACYLRFDLISSTMLCVMAYLVKDSAVHHWLLGSTWHIFYKVRYFLRYLSNKLCTFTSFLGSQKCSFFGQIWSSHSDSYTLTLLDRVYAKLPEQIWASEAKNWLRYGQSSKGYVGRYYFCDFLIDNSGFYVQIKMRALTVCQVWG